MNPHQSPLGQATQYNTQYDAKLLFPIARQPMREQMGLCATLPFLGADIWNAYELSWLNERGKPQIALARIIIPADSPNLVESKSLKLYLGSFAQTKFASADQIRTLMGEDLSALCGMPVSVSLTSPAAFATVPRQELDGLLLDRLELDIEQYQIAPELLSAHFNQAAIEETLVSNLLRSNCPVTGQPDWASIQIRYAGAPIEHAGLLRYLVSYRLHTGFHEQCVERIFMDLMQMCRPTQLAVYARYTRRGGLDINPFRTNFNQPLPDNMRTARQ
ncbi:7-cyano-7-deazaguanine reductase [Mycoavidus cysteinexigens]|uniref:NADPH-dependent 7-cyano-7-deazaguanine reductase n=1 Tax=Mycoavidus cysteinexigens TaxID=1553431 RepID=A0A2Z6EU08_9BURK|nr:NADPH-dependent 7-cyano-7-deazaguanine reductase QueF [Mycoavidus cysteinexigens]BBE08929.1 7-cyano-7-deazaguanine reductase [Mycoavidus cysteinexigens]GAM52348.1 NADPH dependent preQ0 reductase [bacterium endosymbiont of Mortierella elongata FMR23-6]GLR01227.1 NADPH-dependent 7-cyano-7-deazaguanine reductase [Mycoavidus cysteinexigens]